MNHEHIGQLVESKLRTKDIAMIYGHIDGVVAHASFSECMKFRYRLNIELNVPASDKTKTVCAIMQNPSNANSDIADKSAQFLEKLVFTKNNPHFLGVRKLIIVNQFAFIQTNGFLGNSKHVGAENDQYIRNAISESDVILIAWGCSNKYEDRKQAINNIIKGYSDKVLLQGKSHPSRASYNGYISNYCI